MNNLSDRPIIGPMTLARAKQINTDVVDFYLTATGTAPRPINPRIQEYSLAEMVEAARMLDGIGIVDPQGTNIYCVCDERAIAATYTFLHFPIVVQENLEEDQVSFTPILQLGRACLSMVLTPLHTCRECGCTDDSPCEGGCSWVEHDLCSRCLVKQIPNSKLGILQELLENDPELKNG